MSTPTRVRGRSGSSDKLRGEKLSRGHVRQSVIVFLHDVFCKQAKRAVPFEVRDSVIGPRQRYEDLLALYGHA